MELWFRIGLVKRSGRGESAVYNLDYLISSLGFRVRPGPG